MYREHEVFQKPQDENIKIWRFIDFTKFVSLLDTKSLYFNRADLFEDMLEGTYPKPNVYSLGHSSVSEEMKNLMFQTYWVLEKYHVKSYYLNCWHVNEYESDAMWKLYTQGSQAVAIQSTFKKLTQSFEPDSPDVF